MQFQNIPGKTKEKEQLIRLINNGRIPHASLFLGREGSGNLALAFAYITFLLCENKQENDSCGTCKNCVQNSKLIHPDVHYAFPVVKHESKTREQTTSNDFLPQWREMMVENPFFNLYDWQDKINAGNSKPNINTKECNDIISKLSFKSFGDGPKVMILWLPEFLGKEGNRLLKWIEEPTDDTYFILVAEEQSKILNTILSRCQLLMVKPFKPEEIKSYLISKNVKESAIDQAIRLSNGDLNKALNLAEGHDKDYSELLFQWLRISYKSDITEISDFANTLVSMQTDHQLQFLEYGLYFFREFWFWKATKGMNTKLKQEEMAVAQKMTAIINESNLEAITNIFNDSIYNISRNVNIRINFVADSILLGDIIKRPMGKS